MRICFDIKRLIYTAVRSDIHLQHNMGSDNIIGCLTTKNKRGIYYKL